MKLSVLLPICLLLLVPNASHARTWLVRQNGTGDCTSIQACVSLAQAGDSVLVGPGTYSEHLAITVPMSLVSEHGAPQTTIDGGGAYVRCITCSHPSDRVCITGFTITKGGVPSPFPPDNYGGGILCTKAELEVRDCSIVYNFGGGVGCRAGSNVAIIGCDILDNYGELGDPYDVPGDGVTGDNATGTVTGCRISSDDYGVNWSGGQLELGHSELYEYATGVKVLSAGLAWIHHNLIRDGGDGVAIGSSTISVENNTIVAQRHFGYGISVSQCTGSVSNNIVVSGSYYGISCYGTVTLSCNDVWNNAPGNYEGTCSHPTDMSTDPLFCDPLSHNYYLNSASSCANVPGCGQIGAFGVGCGPTAIRETSWGRIKALYR